MTTSQLEQFKEQQKLLHEQQRDQEAKLNEQRKYPYGPWREVFWYPLGGPSPDMHRRNDRLWSG
ncbi:hypothetical protein [Pseudomonas sp. CLCA07]